MSKLLPNLPIENLTAENDYFGIIDTADLIKSFLESNTSEFADIKMFSLYGEWGCGKSTLMKYLEKELKGNFNTFFFEAWEFESDHNLSKSLLEFLLKKSKSASNEIYDDFIDTAEKLFRGFSKSITIKFPGLNINGEKLVQSFEENKKTSFLDLKESFKVEFVRWEDLVTKGKSPNYNIVFIDDLDRCEPENVLNLLSALKLFFTYGKKTIFFCGVDKKAVNQAVKTKYGNIVKSDEYLEKVFDISFSMPNSSNMIKLYEQYFDKEIIYDIFKENDTLPYILNRFFSSLRFNNPRRIKKVLNRFLIIKNIGNNLKADDNYASLFPKILDDKKICVFDLLFTLYFIILKEFHPTLLDDITNDSLRRLNYQKALFNRQDLDVGDSKGGYHKVAKYINVNYKTSSFTNIQEFYKNKPSANFNEYISKFSISFSPISPDLIAEHCFQGVLEFNYNFKVERKEINYYFTYFLLGNLELISKQKIISHTGINEILQLIKSLP